MFDIKTLKEFYTGKDCRILCIGLQKSEYKFLSDYLLEYAPSVTINSSYEIDLGKINIGSSKVNIIVLNNHKDHTKDIQVYYDKKIIVFGTNYDDDNLNKFINMLDGGEFYGNDITEIAKNVARIALFIESRPLYDQNKLFNTLYNIEHMDERVYFENNNTYAIKENSIISIISPDAEDYINFRSLLTKNIIGYMIYIIDNNTFLIQLLL